MSYLVRCCDWFSERWGRKKLYIIFYHSSFILYVSINIYGWDCEKIITGDTEAEQYAKGTQSDWQDEEPNGSMETSIWQGSTFCIGLQVNLLLKDRTRNTEAINRWYRINGTETCYWFIE